MLFQKGDVSIRYVIEEDVNTISKWLTNPEVLQYYEGRDNPQSPEKVRMHFIQNPKSDEKKVSSRIRWRTNWLCANVPDRIRMEQVIWI